MNNQTPQTITSHYHINKGEGGKCAKCLEKPLDRKAVTVLEEWCFN